mgnify:CR=1 FL=1
MFREILTESQQTLLELLSRIPEVRTFYLAGGTALALYLGHRRSRDFDFFRPKEFAPQDLLSVLRETGELDPEDIAAMKLAALAGRGSRKDFVDLYFHARQVVPLERVFELFREKYRGVSVDPYHLLRSLTFFDDADAEAMPELLTEVTWEEIKAFFRAEAARLFRDL